MHAHQALETLLLSLFSADELRRFLRYLPEGEDLAGQLPGANASPATLASEAVAALAKRQALDAGFWERLVAERPRRKAEIDGVRGRFAVAAQPASAAAAATAVTVLMVSASPEAAVRLRVDREFREIITRVRATRHRDRLRFEQVQAASFTDLRGALLEHAPHVLHISSHGLQDGSLVFEARAGEPQVVGKKNLLDLLAALGENLRLVVLNACFSEAIAGEIPPTIDAAIGMNNKVVDQAAIEFGVALYESLGFGKPLERAFKAALAGLADADGQVPQLFPPAGADPDGKRQLKLLEP